MKTVGSCIFESRILRVEKVKLIVSDPWLQKRAKRTPPKKKKKQKKQKQTETEAKPKRENKLEKSERESEKYHMKTQIQNIQKLEQWGSNLYTRKSGGQEGVQIPANFCYLSYMYQHLHVLVRALWGNELMEFKWPVIERTEKFRRFYFKYASFPRAVGI